MQGGDLATWDQPHTIVVLEGVLCSPSWKGRVRSRLTDPETWGWSLVALRSLQRYTLGNVPIDVITFTDQEVADYAAAWLSKYDIVVSSVEHVEIDPFCRSVAWRLNQVQSIVDSDPDRLARYGQKGYQTVHGGEF